MGKCQYLIQKGKKKGLECGIYSSNQVENKFYCSSHLKMIEGENKEPNIAVESIIPPDDDNKSIEEKTFDNGDNIDDIINYEVHKMNKPKSQFDILNDKLDSILSLIKKSDDNPDFEIFN
jgi:hypothetical protein